MWTEEDAMAGGARRQVFAGLELGLRCEGSALVAVEWEEAAGAGLEARRRVRFARRFPAGMTLPDLAREVKVALASEEPGPVTSLALDATGVGEALADVFGGPQRPGYEVLPVWIASGGGAGAEAGGRWTTPREDLMAGLQTLPDRRELETAQGEDSDVVMAAALACWAMRRETECRDAGERLAAREARAGIRVRDERS